MSLDFPDSPAIDEIYTYGSLSYKWSGDRWVAASGTKYIIGCFVPGRLTASQPLLLHSFSRGVTFPTGFTSYSGYASEARGSAAATGAVTIDMRQATAAAPTVFTSVGTISIAAGAVVGTFATSGAVVFAVGDTLALIAPTTADATFAGFAATLAGYES